MLKIYKSGQGKNARLVAAVSLSVLNLYGCYSLFNAINSGKWAELVILEIPGVEVLLTPPLLVSVVLFLAVSFAIYWSCNWHKSADFLIETEAELRKVSWPSKNELVGSSAIVLVVIILLSLLILGIDYIIANIMRFFYHRA
ncbi:MAG: preprotein translocase subunit SecE [Planctomycetota bacterium]